MRRLLVATLIAGSATFVGVSPAQAAPAAPVLTGLTTATPGHVTGTVTGGADAQSAWVCFSGCQVNTGQVSGGWIALDPTTHSASFDLPTWGWTHGEVAAVVCSKPAPTGCSPQDTEHSAQTVSADLPTSDVLPTITFSPLDARIGVGELLVATVADPDGGGLLRARWTADDDDGRTATTQLDRDGETEVEVGEGRGTVEVWRCAEVGSYRPCSRFTPGVELDVETHRKDLVSVEVREPATAAHPFIDVTARSLFAASAITVDWQVTDPWGGPREGAPSGQTSGTTDADGAFAFSIDASGLPTDAYGLTGTVHVKSPEWGAFTTELPAEGPWIDVDTDAPSVTSMTTSRSLVRPESTTSNTVAVDAAGPNAGSGDAFVLLDPKGQPIRVLETTVDHGAGWHATFDGRRDDGTPLPSGLYTIIVRDPAGNVGGTSVTVRVQRLVTRTTRTTLTARGSKVDQYVGRCSTLRTPASRGWTGSLGYYANTRCRSTRWADSAVATQHRAVMPAAASYVDVQVAVYSGASRGYGRSQAVMLYDNPTETAAVGQRTLGAALATRAAPRVAAAKVLRTVSGRRYLYWEVATANAQRYDVKSFTVTVRYRIWA